jgi:hypothetical protein
MSDSDRGTALPSRYMGRNAVIELEGGEESIDDGIDQYHRVKWRDGKCE